MLSRIACQLFQPSVLREALAAVVASHMDYPRTREKVLSFIEGLSPDSGEADPRLALKLTTSTMLCRLDQNLAFFIAKYHSRSMALLAQRSHAEPQGAFKSIPSCTRLCRPFSTIEIVRLQRAFCRFETYRHLFARVSEDSRTTAFDHVDQSHLFLERLPKWEIEEIACVRDFLSGWLLEIFDVLEDDFVRDVRLGNITWKNEVPTHWEMDHYWFSTYAKADHNKYTEHLLSLGLPFLRQVLESSSEQRANLVISNRSTGSPFLTDALTKPKRPRHSDTSEMLDYIDGVITLNFDYNRLDVYNMGWVWAHKGRPALRWADGCFRGLRDWGYVFWDKERLVASGILDLK